MCVFVLIVTLLCFTSIMLAPATARLRSLVIRFDNYKKSPYVSMKEHLRHMSNVISELAEMGYELNDE